MRNYFEKHGNKTYIFAQGKRIIVDTDVMKKLETFVTEIKMNRFGFAEAILKNGEIVPLSVYVSGMKMDKNRKVRMLNGKLDYRRKYLKQSKRQK